MILERLNLQELLEEEKKNLEELEKLKTSQRSNPPKQKSPGAKSEVNRTTGIIVERTIENIDHNNHTSVVSGAEKTPDFVSKIRNSQLVSQTDTEPDKEQHTEADSKPNISPENLRKKPLGNKQVNKSLNIHDVSLTDMLDSSIEDDENANVSSIVGSLCVGSTYTNLSSQASFASTNNQKSNMKLSVPSKTSTPIRTHKDKNTKVNPNFNSSGTRGLFSSTEENRPLVPPDENQAANKIRTEKSTVRKAIENRLTQVNHRSNPTEPSMDGSEANHDFLSTIEGEHKLICVTDKQAKKSKENSGKKLASKLKQKLNALASGKKQDDNNMQIDKDDFEEENPIVGRKRKRTAVIEDDDDDDIFDSINTTKNEDSMKVNRAGPESLKGRGVGKPRKGKTKPSKPAVKHNSEEVSANKRPSDDSVPPTGRRDTENGSNISKSTLSKLQKFAFDDSRSDKSASSDSFESNSSLSSGMLSGSLWLSDKTGTNSAAKSKSDRDNMVNSHGHEGVDSHINVDAESITDASSNRCSTVNETSSTKDGQKTGTCTNITYIESNYVSSLPSPVTSCDTATSKGGILQKLKSPDMTKEMRTNIDKSNHTGLRTAKTVSSFGCSENSKVNSDPKTEMPSSDLKTKENDSGVKNTSILTGSSPSWLAALKSKKPSPIFSISESNDLDLELDDLEFSDNPFKRPKFS